MSMPKWNKCKNKQSQYSNAEFIWLMMTAFDDNAH